jgi:hypothetical protein
VPLQEQVCGPAVISGFYCGNNFFRAVLQGFCHPFAMPSWLAMCCFQVCLVAATAFSVDQSSAGPTSGGGVITVTQSVSWNQYWTPVITLHGMQIAATEWVVDNAQGKIRIKVPPGPGCVNNFLIIMSRCALNAGPCGGDMGTVLRLSTTLNYDPPTISMVEPTLAQFGTSDDATRTMTISGTNFGKNCPDIPTVQVSS